jgi:hypothetical protein
MLKRKSETPASMRAVIVSFVSVDGTHLWMRSMDRLWRLPLSEDFEGLYAFCCDFVDADACLCD